MYVDKSIRNYLALIESGEPTPGGGSAASLVSNLGAALTLMTSNFSITKKYFKELDLSIQEKVLKTHNEIQKSIVEFNRFMDEDAKGFASVIRAYNEDISETKEQRKKRLEESYKKALTAPLHCSRECLKLLKLQDTIVEYGNNDTITDVGVGVILVFAALEGCLMSVKINLNYIEDEAYTNEIRSEISNIYKEASTINDCLRGNINNILEI